MDTPAPVKLSKGPRRKLKRVLKKNKLSSSFSHNSSNHSLYQKKLKNAINTSLNLTSNVRTLQANNRSLALQVAKLREELRRVFNEHMRLLEDNHSLNERILELERQLDLTPSIIEHEVNSRCQAKVQTMQCHIDLLLENASVFTKGLMELRECYTASPRKSGNSSAAHSFRRSARLSRSGDTTVFLDKIGSRASHGRDEGLLKSPTTEMSILAESSHLEAPLLSVTSPCPVPEDLMEEEEKRASYVTSRFSSWPPQRKHVSRLERGDSTITSQGLSSGNKEIPFSTITVRRSGRKNSQQIGEARSPLQKDQETLKELRDTTGPELAAPENDKLFINLNEAAVVEGSPADCRSDIGVQKSPSRPTNIRRNINQVNTRKTKRNSEVTTSPSISAKSTLECSPAYESITADERSHASWSPVSPSREKTTYIIQDMELTAGVFDDPCNKTMQSPKLASAPFEEHSVVEKLSRVNGTLNAKSSSVAQDKEGLNLCGKTRLPLPTTTRSLGRHESGKNDEDKSESTSVPDAISMRVSKGGKLLFAVSRKGADGFRAVVQASTRVRSKSKKGQKVDIVQSQGCEGEQDVENIFDFHDKTPKSLQHTQQQSSMSVFSLSADESALSPLGALNQLREASKNKDMGKTAIEVPKDTDHVKNMDKTNSSSTVSRSRSRNRNVIRSRNRSRNKQCEELNKVELPRDKLKDQDINCQGITCFTQADSSASLPGSPVKGIASTFVGEVYMEPLKGSPEARPKYRTRSQSRGRKKSSSKQSPENDRKVRSKSVSSAGSPTRGRGRSRRKDKGSESPEVLSKRMTDPLTLNSLAAVEGHTGLEKMNQGTEHVNQSRKEGVETSVVDFQTNSIMAADRTKRNSCFQQGVGDKTEPKASGSYRKSSETVTNLTSENGIPRTETILTNRNQVMSKTEENEYGNLNTPCDDAKSKTSCVKKDQKLKAISPGRKSRKETSDRSKPEKKDNSTKQKDEDENQKIDKFMKHQEIPRKFGRASVSSSPNAVSERDAVTHEGHSPEFSVRDDQVTSRHSSKQTLIVETEERITTAPLLASGDKLKLRCVTNQTIRSQEQHTTVAVMDQPEVQDIKSDDSPERTNLKQRQKKTSKSTAKKSTKKQQKNQSQNDEQDNMFRAAQSQCSQHSTDAAVISPDNNQADQASGADDAGDFLVEQQIEDHTSKTKGQETGGETPATSSSPLPKGPKVSKIVKNSSNLFNFSTDSESLSPNREGRKRRAASNVSYVAPRLNSKLRRGDPFTSHYAAEKISIYKSPKSKAKEKAKLRRDVLGLLHNLAIKEDPESADVEQE